MASTLAADPIGVARMDRLRQIWLVIQTTREADPRAVPLMVAVGVGVFAIVFAVGLLTGNAIVGAAVGVTLGLLAAVVVLGRRATSVQLGSIEGRPGAALAVVQTMRGPWRVTPAVAVTRKQDLVHRVVGRPGVVLVGEGARPRVQAMLKKEHRRMQRVVGDTPVHEVIIGDGEGEVGLRELRMHLMRLPRRIKKHDVESLDTKLRALSDSDLPMPKGYIPRGRPR
ncbi:MAG: DUF4191 domain-containing protein [Actinomycetota bacterium]|nr:DUF4191 domain-containing protein [Actinomycetota bacterium]